MNTSISLCTTTSLSLSINQSIEADKLEVRPIIVSQLCILDLEIRELSSTAIVTNIRANLKHIIFALGLWDEPAISILQRIANPSKI
jgi:hypothetical protein